MDKSVPIKQTKFNNGEISPLLYGDTSHPKYGASLRTCLNWIPTPQGALSKRPGLRFIAPVKDASYTPRLIPFVFSDGQAFVLEFGNLYARVYKNGQYAGNDGVLHSYLSGAAYYEIVTPYTTAMLPYLKFNQVGNTLTIVYGGQVAGVAALAPRDLKHTASALTPWTLGLTPLKIPITSVPSAPTVNILAWDPGYFYSVGEMASRNNILWCSLQSANFNNAPPAVALNAAQTGLQGNLWWTPAVDPAHMAVSVLWVTTAIVQDPDGIVYETGPSAPTTGTGPLSTDRAPPLLINPGGMTPALPAGWTLLNYKQYRASKNGLYGWIADVSVAAGTYNDIGNAPNYTIQPPAGTDPFVINAADSYPSVVGYLDQRRLWAASALLPSSMFLSKIGDLYNYDNLKSPGADTDAFNVLLASEVLEEIRSFVPMRRGLILTGQGEWAVAGAGGSPVSRSNVDPKRQSKWGSSWLNPLIIGTGILFNTAKSNMVRDLYPLYGLYADIWDGQDLSVMASHLLNLYTLRNWAFQSVPYPMVWAVRSDGTLLSITYQHAPPSFGQQLADGVVAWAKHTTGVGSDAFEEVCVVPEPPDDAVYVVVKRLVNGVTVRNIERMENPICPASPYLAGISDVRYGRFVDSSANYDGHNDQIGYAGVPASIDSVAVPGSVVPADYAAGKQIVLNIAGGPFTVPDAFNPYGSGFVFDPENALGLNFVTSAAGIVSSTPAARAHVVAFVNSAQVIVELDSNMTQAQVTAWRAGQTSWAIAKSRVAVAHLSGYALDNNEAGQPRGVTCLADGDVQVPDLLAAGVAYLTTPAVVIQIGISYNCDVVLLDAHHQQAEIRNKMRNVLRMGFEVAGTRDMWVGKDFDHLQQWNQKSVVDAYNVMGLQTGYFEEFITGEWNKNGQGVLRHCKPLPAVLSSVLREIRLGDT